MRRCIRFKLSKESELSWAKFFGKDAVKLVNESSQFQEGLLKERVKVGAVVLIDCAGVTFAGSLPGKGPDAKPKEIGGFTWVVNDLKILKQATAVQGREPGESPAKRAKRDL